MDVSLLSKQQQTLLEILSTLSYRTGNLNNYLYQITTAISDLLNLDWSVVTLCTEQQEKVMASSLDMGEGEHIYSLHGTLTGTVVKTGQTLMVEDAIIHPEYGEPPEGYTSYLGVPLRTASEQVIGTLCSFCRQPRQFSLEEVRTAELFAERAATAIDNYLLYQQQQQFNHFLELEIARRTEELKLAQSQLIERERLAAIGEFATMIVHEIRNPMTTILMGLNYFQKKAVSEADQIRASLSVDEANRLQHLLGEILLYAKPQVLQKKHLELNQLIQSFLPTLQEMPEAEGKTLNFTPLKEPVIVDADRDKFKQVLINLIKNSYEAITYNDFVNCYLELKPEMSQVYIIIQNGGNPISEQILSTLTQPFCSGKPGGTGLGLAIVKRIIEAHGGELTIESQARSGTTVKLMIPYL